MDLQWAFPGPSSLQACCLSVMFQSRKWCSLGEFGTWGDAVPSSVRQTFTIHTFQRHCPLHPCDHTFLSFSLLNSPCSQSCRFLPFWDSVTSLPCPDSSRGGMEGSHVLGQTACSPSPENPVHLAFPLCMPEAGSLGLREVISGP